MMTMTVSKAEKLHRWTVVYNEAEKKGDVTAKKQAEQRITELFHGLPKKPIKV
jgi:hypothetical protein